MLYNTKARSRFAAHNCAALLSLLGTVCAHGAMANQTCQGSYTATLLNPLPKQVVVGLDVRVGSPRNRQLADRFLAGVRNAGVAVGTQPNVLLHITTSRLGDTSSRPSAGARRKYPESSGLVGAQPVLPPLPSTGLTAPRSASTPPLLFMRVDATVGNASRVSWLAALQCRMIGSDEGQLAEDLGQVVGKALGHRIERQPL